MLEHLRRMTFAQMVSVLNAGSFIASDKEPRTKRRSLDRVDRVQRMVAELSRAEREELIERMS